MTAKILFIVLMIAVLILFVFMASAIALLFHLYGEEHPNSVNVHRGKTSMTTSTRITRKKK